MRFRTLAFGAMAAVVLALPATTAMHTHLVRAEPGEDSTVTVAPKQIRFWWSDPTDPALTTATLLKADRTPVGVVKMAATDDSLSTAGPIAVALEPGKYIVLYKTASHDGHVVRGNYTFTYDPAAKP